MSIRSHRSRSTRGSATILWALVLALAVGLLHPTAEVVEAVVDRARARTAADAAALAAAHATPGQGHARAEDIAWDNGGIVMAYEERGDVVEVMVRVGTRRATARAERIVTHHPWVPPTIP